MYKAIIVDDEKWIVEGIKAGVEWNRFGFEVAGDAANGQEALGLMETLRPDVVLTDIKMPVLNGLELIKQGRELYPDTLFVVLSAHAEFAYAQKALNYGTFGYCLKPFEIEEIHGMLNRLAASLSARHKSPSLCFSPALYEAICGNETEQAGRIIRDYGMSVHKNSKIKPVVLQAGKLPTPPDQLQHLSFQMSPRRFGFLVYEDQADAFIRHLKAAAGFSEYSIGVGHTIADCADLSFSLEAASLASYGKFATGHSGMFTAPPSLNPLAEEFMKNLAEALDKKDRVRFNACMNAAKTHFHNGKFSIKDAYLIFTAVMTLFYREGASSSAKVFEGYEQLSTYFGSAEAMIDYLVEHTLNYLSGDVPAWVSEVSHKTIQKVLAHIHDNFTQDLSIQGMSEKFYLSPNYLCHLFKKEVGENFIEYISRLRIEYACRLLAETDLPVKQIGDNCGFNDYFYFTRIFKRIVSLTPTQYRERAAE